MPGTESRLVPEDQTIFTSERKGVKKSWIQIIKDVADKMAKNEKKRTLEKSEPKPKKKTKEPNKNLSKDIKNLAAKKPSRREISNESRSNIDIQKIGAEKWLEQMPIKTETSSAVQEKFKKKSVEGKKSDKARTIIDPDLVKDKYGNTPSTSTTVSTEAIYDDRVLQVLQDLIDIDEDLLGNNDPQELYKLQQVAENLTRLSVATEYTTETAKEAQLRLRKLKEVYVEKNTDEEFQKDLDKLIDVASSDGVVDDGFFKTLNKDNLSFNTRITLYNIENALEITPKPTIEDYRRYLGLLNTISDPNLSSEEFLTVDSAKKMIESQIMILNKAALDARENPRETGFSSMYLNEEEKKAFVRDYRVVYQHALYEAYRPEYFPVESPVQDRLRMYAQWLESDEFDKYLEEVGGIASVEDRELFRAEVRNFHAEHKFKVDAKIAASLIELGQGDARQLADRVGSVGEKGWALVASDEGGLNAYAFNLLTAIAQEEGRFTENGESTRFDSLAFKNAADRVKVILKSQEQLLKVISGNSELQLTDEKIHHIVQSAQVLAVLRGKSELAILKGAGASEGLASGGELPVSGFADAGAAESRAAVMDVVRFSFEKWHSLSPGEKRQFFKSSVFAGIDVGIEKAVDAQIALERKSPDYKTKRDKALYDEWGNNFEKAPSEAAKHMRAHMDDEYKDLLLFKQGKLVFGEMLEMYDHDTSGFRVETMLQQINGIWNETDTFGLGLWLRRAGISFLEERGHHAEEVFYHGSKSEKDSREKSIGEVPGWSHVVGGKEQHGLSVYAVLRKIGEFRPHQIGLMLHEQKDGEFKSWLSQESIQSQINAMITGKKTTFNPDSYMHVHSFVSERFQAIKGILEKHNMKMIDYSKGDAGLSEDQRNIVKGVLAAYGDERGGDESVAAFMAFMKSLSTQVSKDSEIDNFKSLKYRFYLKRTQWVDDARLGDLDNPNQMVGDLVNPDAAKKAKYSDIVVLKGSGRRSPLARFWGDLANAQELVPLIAESFGPDAKKMFELIKKIKDGEKAYAGQANGARTVSYLLAGYGGMAMSDNRVLNALSLSDNVPNTSEFRRWFGKGAPSLGLNDLHHLIENADMIFGRLKAYPHLHETIHELEKYVGLISKNGLLGSGIGKDTMYPLWGYRSKLVIAIIAGIIALDLVTQTTKDMQKDGAHGH